MNGLYEFAKNVLRKQDVIIRLKQKVEFILIFGEVNILLNVFVVSSVSFHDIRLQMKLKISHYFVS